MNFKKLALSISSLALVASLGVVASPAHADDNVEVNLTNENTGPHSTNTNRVRVRNSHQVTHNKKARIRNRVNLNVDTGHNESNQNTTGGEVTSGDVNIEVNITNENVNSD